jgi:hypothetical protein
LHHSGTPFFLILLAFVLYLLFNGHIFSPHEGRGSGRWSTRPKLRSGSASAVTLHGSEGTVGCRNTASAIGGHLRAEMFLSFLLHGGF